MVIKKINIKCFNNLERGYLIGLFVGDGYLYHDKWGHYKINFYFNPNKDKDIAEITYFLLKKLGLSPYFMFNHGCLIVRSNSKQLFSYIQKEIPKIENQIDKKFIIGFISGFIDSDGYVEKGDIVISNTKNHFLIIVQKFCKFLEINTNLWMQDVKYNGKIFKIWRLRISTRFKYEKHYSQKIHRIYRGALPIIASKYPRDITYKGGVARRSRRAHNP